MHDYVSVLSTALNFKCDNRPLWRLNFRQEVVQYLISRRIISDILPPDIRVSALALSNCVLDLRGISRLIIDIPVITTNLRDCELILTISKLTL